LRPRKKIKLQSKQDKEEDDDDDDDGEKRTRDKRRAAAKRNGKELKETLFSGAKKREENEKKTYEAGKMESSPLLRTSLSIPFIHSSFIHHMDENRSVVYIVHQSHG
jgi:hypothetical protein